MDPQIPLNISPHYQPLWLTKTLKPICVSLLSLYLCGVWLISQFCKLPIVYMKIWHNSFNKLDLFAILPKPQVVKDTTPEAELVSNFTHSKLISNVLAHHWALDNFSCYFNEENSSYGMLSSNEFAPFPDKSLRYQLILYPNGMSMANQDYISLYLKLVSAQESEVTTQYRFSIEFPNGVKRNTKGNLIFTIYLDS